MGGFVEAGNWSGDRGSKILGRSLDHRSIGKWARPPGRSTWFGKTLAVKTLSQCMRAEFKRIQFTPDLLPADVIGTLIYSPNQGKFTTKKGPIFTNLLLADEINRAPAKVQSALLEGMQERQVTIGDEYPLPQPFSFSQLKIPSIRRHLPFA